MKMQLLTCPVRQLADRDWNYAV